jgi:hypothetical protein
LIKDPVYNQLAKKIESETRPAAGGGGGLRRFISILLQTHEREILFAADTFLDQRRRPFSVFIHDGGLIHRKAEESDIGELLCDLNRHICQKLKYEYIQFVTKSFDNTLGNLIDKESPLYLEYDYTQWKHYLEVHRDLCYISKENAFCFADNKQTHLLKSLTNLRQATSNYSVFIDTLQPINFGTNSIETVDGFGKKTLNYTDMDLIQQQQGDLVENSIATLATDATMNHHHTAAEEFKKQPTSETGTSDSLSIPDRSSNASSTSSKKIRKKYLFIDLWIRDPTKREFDMIYFSEKTARRDSYLTYLTPYGHQNKFIPNHRYVFQGWDLLNVQSEKDSTHVPFLELLSNLFPNKQSESYILNWLAHLFQYPDERIVGTCLALISDKQGTGKSTFLDAILSLLMRYGRKLTKVQEELFNNFTNVMEFNVLLAIDDSNSDALRKNYEDFKNLITSDEARIRELYSPERQIITNVRFMVVSNNPLILKLEQNSRRFAVFEPSSNLVGKYGFFKKWKNEYWASLSNRKAVLTFLLNHRLPDDWHPEQSYSVTSLKKEIEASNLSLVCIYIYALARTVDSRGQGKFWDVPAKELKDKFKFWVDVYYYKKERTTTELPNRNEFPVELSKLGVFNTKNLPIQKKYSNAEHYRIPILDCSEKANTYNIDMIETDFIPTSGHFIL